VNLKPNINLTPVYNGLKSTLKAMRNINLTPIRNGIKSAIKAIRPANITAMLAPRFALQREAARVRLSALRSIKNSGYGESGGSHKRKSLLGWLARSKSPQEDIDPHLHTLRQRSRDLFMSSPLGRSAINTKKTNTIGTGLILKSRVDHRFLGLSEEEAQRWERNTEREFDLFARSKWCDALRLNNFYELQPLAYSSWLLNGDGWCLLRHEDPTKWMPYGLRLHLIEADRINTPDTSERIATSYYSARPNMIGKNKSNGNYIYSGVEVNKNGAVVAYWICNQYPNSNIPGEKKEWKRVEAFGRKTGNPNILQLLEQERCEQYRGVPFLTPVIEHLKQITRYTEAELMGAVVQALFTVFIKTTSPTSEIPFGDMIPESEQVNPDDDTIYELGAGAINVLKPGEDMVFADPKRPASGFEMFINTMAKMIGAALEIPYELLMKSFTASYSASRASLLEAWKAIKTSRAWFVSDFCQPVYEIWLSEAVARGRINAPGFFNDPAIRAAWCQAQWIGPAQGMIDPVKEVTAAKLRVEEGFSTREQETVAISGGNWDDNIEQVKAENEKLREANGLTGEVISQSNGEITNAMMTVVKNATERSLVESE